MNDATAPIPSEAAPPARWVIHSMTFVMLLAVFVIAPPPGGDDWQAMVDASIRLTAGEPLYGVNAPYYYANPPHLAALLVPVGWLPALIHLALIRAVSITLALMLLQRWCDGDVLAKFTLTFLSPPMIYILLHGEIDVVMLAGVFLPPQWWGLVVFTKPNIMLGMVFNIPRRQWLKAGVIIGVVIGASLIFLGNWITAWLAQSPIIAAYPHNLWRGLWPFQVPLGMFLLLQGLKWREERLLIASSPFLVPYANIGNLMGCWLVAVSYLNKRESLVLLVVWWGVVLVRVWG